MQPGAHRGDRTEQNATTNAAERRLQAMRHRAEVRGRHAVKLPGGRRRLGPTVGRIATTPRLTECEIHATLCVVSIKWLVVDMGGVSALWRPDRRLAALAKATGLLPDDIHERLFTSGFDLDAESGKYGLDEIVPRTLERLDHRLDAEALIQAWSLAFVPNLPVLGCVGRATVRTCLFTNNGPLVDLCLDGPLAAVREPFEVLIAAWNLKARKPDPLAFDRVSARLGARPAELLFVDDDADNVLTAQALGWHAVAYEDDSILESVLNAHQLLPGSWDNR